MTTHDVLNRISKRLKISLRKTRQAYESSTLVMRGHLMKGESFGIPRLGTFGTTTRKQRQAYNPYYGKKITIPEQRVVVFKSSVTLKKNINGAKNDR